MPLFMIYLGILNSSNACMFYTNLLHDTAIIFDLSPFFDVSGDMIPTGETLFKGPVKKTGHSR